MALQGEQDLGGGQAPGHVVVALAYHPVEVWIGGFFVGVLQRFHRQTAVFAGQVQDVFLINRDTQLLTDSEGNLMTAAAELPSDTDDPHGYSPFCNVLSTASGMTGISAAAPGISSPDREMGTSESRMWALPSQVKRML